MTRNLDNESRDNNFRDYTYGIDGIVRDFLLCRIEKFISRNSKVLEIGSHDGFMTERLLRYFERVTVLEPVKHLAETVKLKFAEAVSVEIGTIVENVIKEKFDLVFLVHVLEHLANPIDELVEIKRFLNHQGLVVIMVPNANALSRIIAVEMGLIPNVECVTEGERLQGHQRTYTMNTLQSHSESAGYQVIEKGGILLKPLANFQMDLALSKEIITDSYINALNILSEKDFTYSSSIFVVLKSR